jgi:lipopolysaccharide/colanic/teichoic acid biosynthesis glycosyltransferase
MGAVARSGRGSVLSARRTARPFDLLRTVDAAVAQRRLEEAHAAHVAAGVLPARRSNLLKRAFDLIVTIGALSVTLPFYPLIVFLIRSESAGPALYRQVRIGKGGRPFVVYKFRTMRQIPPEQAHAAQLEIFTKWSSGAPLGATAAVPEPALARIDRENSHGAGGARDDTSRHWEAAPTIRQPARGGLAASPFKYTDDPRITRIGHILRKTSIDELPQFLNVLRGEMSVVGPRPALLCEVEQYNQQALARLQVLPGITGRWQVEGRGRVDFDGMVDLDLEYVGDSSLWRDITLVLRTIPAVLKGDGAG